MFTILGADGREYGPVTPTQVKAWIAEGRANLDTKVKPQGGDAWSRLGDLPDFNDGPPLSTSKNDRYGQPVFRDTLPLANRWLRFGARLIDNCFSTLCIGPGLLFAIIPLVRQAAENRRPENFDFTALIPAIPIFLLGLTVYGTVQIWLLTTRGQSLGKMLVKIRIVRIEDESNPGFIYAVLLRGFIPWMISMLIGIFGIVDVCFIFRDDQRCLHDLIASTKVVAA